MKRIHGTRLLLAFVCFLSLAALRPAAAQGVRPDLVWIRGGHSSAPNALAFPRTRSYSARQPTSAP